MRFETIKPYMVGFSVKNATTFVIRNILKFIKIITRGGGKLKTFEFLNNMQL